MNVTLARLKVDEYPFFLKLYEYSFPEEERRPYSSPEELDSFLKAHPDFNIYGIYSDSGIVGFISVWKMDGWIYGEHLATIPELRGSGLGAATLEQIKRLAEQEDGMLLEVELPDNEMARRRIDYYIRQGFILHPDFRYFQPPYFPGAPEVEMLIMTYGGLTPSDDIIKKLRSKVYEA